MNLIEQLGGYERAKDGLHRLKLEKKDLLTCGDLVVVESEIDAALIEYRRHHNIFEVGDKVVSRCADKEIRIFTYQETIGRNILVKCKKGKGYCYPKKWFSHANDAEIKAGKRLEVNQ